ncbi:hypothetical protein SARC_10396 [Sphaeroforma arctica JP610]|uniref:Bet v I/Major latex protein domain-containing protein n=1 Tax=Sphaeroforma arctica JP610 TaxID=667725 RepID=A0A0L0FK40_9EUKA|nr:hypothetical protein SARC_10396 [Sphaeroforma arctica JP610]KNC77137.1 hypothetical protein SARC_10396 [Sphaeroforma arctica JP610]|eukprot:XP_014151039.1 hypothetical protein SARC_10396 [Sphaeroforma arctica JP610]
MSTTRVHESCVIKAPIEKIWTSVRNGQFTFWSSLKSAEVSGVEGQVGGTITLTFKDDTVQVVKILEISDYLHTLTYELVSSEPAISVMSAIHTIKLNKVTVDNSTFCEWISDYSSDVNQSVIQDSLYKRREAFADMASALE